MTVRESQNTYSEPAKAEAERRWKLHTLRSWPSRRFNPKPSCCYVSFKCIIFPLAEVRILKHILAVQLLILLRTESMFRHFWGDPLIQIQYFFPALILIAGISTLVRSCRECSLTLQFFKKTFAILSSISLEACLNVVLPIVVPPMPSTAVYQCAHSLCFVFWVNSKVRIKPLKNNVRLTGGYFTQAGECLVDLSKVPRLLWCASTKSLSRKTKMCHHPLDLIVLSVSFTHFVMKVGIGNFRLRPFVVVMSN